LGSKVSWNEEARKVTIEDKGNKIELVIGEDAASYNGATVKLDVPSKIYKGYTYVPARFVSEALGCAVDWFDGRIAVPSVSNPILSGAHYFYYLPQVMISRYPSDAKPWLKVEAVEKIKREAIKAFEKEYGKFEPLSEKPAAYLQKNALRHRITSLSVKSESDRFYVIDFIKEIWVDKYTGKAYIFSNGNPMTVIPYESDKPEMLLAAG
jgi:hypothetical protein